MTSNETRSAEIFVALPLEDTMALFTPEGERSWADREGWDPHYPVPSRTEGEAAVFFTEQGARTTIWVMVDQEVDRVRYARATPGGLAGTVEVRAVSHSPSGTRVRVTYDLTALTDDAVDELRRFSADYDAYIETWAKDIAEQIAA